MSWLGGFRRSRRSSSADKHSLVLDAVALQAARSLLAIHPLKEDRNGVFDGENAVYSCIGVFCRFVLLTTLQIAGKRGDVVAAALASEWQGTTESCLRSFVAALPDPRRPSDIVTVAQLFAPYKAVDSSGVPQMLVGAERIARAELRGTYPPDAWNGALASEATYYLPLAVKATALKAGLPDPYHAVEE